MPLEERPEHSKIIILLVLVAGLLLSAQGAWFLYKAEEKEILFDFTTEVNDRVAALYSELAINFEALHSLSVMYSGGSIPSKERFSAEAKKILERRNNIQALEWIPRVSHKERASYEKNISEFYSAAGFTEREQQGAMISAKTKDEYFPVYYLEPEEGNRAAIGFDLSSDPSRLETLGLSRDSGKPLACASIKLVQERGQQKGFLVFLPVYKKASGSVEERRENLIGFILGVYRIGDIFESSLSGERLNDSLLMLIENHGSGEYEALYTHHTLENVDVDLTYKKQLPDVLSRNWSVVAKPASSYVSSKRSNLPLAVFISGLLLTIAVCIYLRLLFSRAQQLDASNERLRALSLEDGLTGVLNRRGFDNYLSAEWKRAIRGSTSVSLLLVDIDHFKEYNDAYGHQHGDECLTDVAQTLCNVVKREQDKVARYGGEEFGIILPDTRNVVDLAEKCREAIESLGYRNEFSPGEKVLTISIGVHTMKPKIGVTADKLVELADQALYKAKKAGRNRVETVE